MHAVLFDEIDSNGESVCIIVRGWRGENPPMELPRVRPDTWMFDVGSQPRKLAMNRQSLMILFWDNVQTVLFDPMVF